MENNEEKVQEQATMNVAEEIETLKAQKEELLKAQEEHNRQQLEELAKLKAEVEELKAYKFPEPVVEAKVTDPIKLIEEKFEKLDYALANFEHGHPERSPFTITDSYNGQNLLDGYYRYTKGEKVEDIFRNPLE